MFEELLKYNPGLEFMGNDFLQNWSYMELEVVCSANARGGKYGIGAMQITVNQGHNNRSWETEVH